MHYSQTTNYKDNHTIKQPTATTLNQPNMLTPVRGGREQRQPIRVQHQPDSLRRSSVKLETIQIILSWPLRKDDTHNSRSVIRQSNTHLYVDLCVYIYIYIHIYALHITHVYMYICVYIYIYIYI